jgi:hypothetical protein
MVELLNSLHINLFIINCYPINSDDNSSLNGKKTLKQSI